MESMAIDRTQLESLIATIQDVDRRLGKNEFNRGYAKALQDVLDGTFEIGME